MEIHAAVADGGLVLSAEKEDIPPPGKTTAPGKLQEKLIIHVDGGARGNPGPSACAFVAFEGAVKVHSDGTFLGQATNNEAEYQGLLLALKWLANSERSALVKMDSRLVVEQVAGRWKAKAANLRPFISEARELVRRTGSRVVAVPREENHSADAEVNRILDEEI